MKVYKVTLMIIDHDELGENGIVETIENVNYPNDCIAPEVMDIESRDIGEWEDDNPLNSHVTSDDEFARVFGSKS
jgi:hypothetical protein